MTVGNRNIADKVMVVGNIQLSFEPKILEKTNTEYIDIIESTPRNTAAAIAFAAFALICNDILIIPSDHIIDDMGAYERLDQAVEKHLKDILLLLDCPRSRKGMGT
jgi:mannose-1-phosphate guanylyltransferase